MRKTVFGGQALIEGLMIKGPTVASIAVRKPDNEIIVKKVKFKTGNTLKKILKIPVLRGIIEFFRLMVYGIKALMYSAEFFEVEEDVNAKPSKLDAFLEEKFGDKLQSIMIYFAVFMSLIFTIGLFILLPNFIANFLGFNRNTASGVLYYNFFESVIRIGIFVGYLAMVSRMKDIQRIWQYHGAEHKTIHCYEHEEELTVENIRKYSVRHPRCGTSFLLVVIILSVLIFSVVGWHTLIVNIILRVLLTPIVAGVSYELFKIIGRSENKIISLLNVPGMALQKFTTSEPDDSMLEVAIAAFNGALEEDEGADEW